MDHKTNNAEAFVYRWTDHGRNMFYIGVHKGSPDDGYVCSSELMLLEYEPRPGDFSRKILALGTWPEMLVKEQELIVSTGAVKSPGYYNQANNFGPYYYHGPHTQKTKDLMSAAWTLERRTQKSAAQSGKSHSPERIARMATSLSSDWQVIFPDGHEETIRNLNAFCWDQGLNQSHMVQVSKGHQKQHKGFRCTKLPRTISVKYGK